MSPEAWIAVIGALTAFVAAVGSAVAAIIGALRANTIATQQSTAATVARIQQHAEAEGAGGDALAMVQPLLNAIAEGVAPKVDS